MAIPRDFLIVANFLFDHSLVIMTQLPVGGATIALRGVEYMNDDPTEVDVLYAKLDTQGKPAGSIL